MKVMFCGFGNPDNRGCEAIIRTVSGMTKEAFPIADTIAMSNDYGKVEMPTLEEINRYVRSYYPHDGKFGTYVYYGLYKLFGGALTWCELCNSRMYHDAGDIDLCISVGGDNFCYNNQTDCFLVHHSHYSKKEAKLIHWGSSFEKDLMYPKLVKDLNKFDLIMVRESISYDTLMDAKIKSDVRLIPDPAFTMKPERPEDYKDIPEGCIGVNISPMIIGKEHHANAVKNNVINLINYITDECKENVLLIPHVCSRRDGTGDYSVMRDILQEVNSPENCKLVGYTYSALELKYIISKCKMFIGARTHATIAAYSTCVPTLTIGYSVKAKGIATDLFGRYEDYVIPTQELTSDIKLVEGFKWLNDNESDIRKHLKEIMPDYIEKAHSAVNLIKEVANHE